MGSFCIYKQQKRISILCYGEFMESAIIHNIRCLSFSVVYKCRRIPSYDLKYTLTSLSSKVAGEYIITLYLLYWRKNAESCRYNLAHFKFWPNAFLQSHALILTSATVVEVWQISVKLSIVLFLKRHQYYNNRIGTRTIMEKSRIMKEKLLFWFFYGFFWL